MMQRKSHLSQVANSLVVFQEYGDEDDKQTGHHLAHH